MALCAEIVDFIRLSFLNNANQIGGISQVTIVKFDARIIYMWILENMINSICIKARCTTLDAMNRIAFVQQELSQVRAILTGNTCDQCNF